MKLSDVIYANFTNLAYINWEGIKPGTSIKDALFDIRKKNANKLNTLTEHIFMVYSEDEKYESPLWDREFDGWKFVSHTNYSRLLRDRFGKVGVPDNGFYAYTVSNDTDVIISFRGTNDIKDAIADLTLYIGGFTTQIVAAYMYAKSECLKAKLTGKKVHLVGHSLGGALVQAVMANKNICEMVEDCVTFNTFGIRTLLERWNSNQMSTTTLLSAVGWMGLPNSGIIVNELQKLAGLDIDGLNGRRHNSILGTLYTIRDIENIINRAKLEYVSSGASFNVVVEIDSSIFKNLKYRFGTVSSKPFMQRQEDIEYVKSSSNKETRDFPIKDLEVKAFIIFETLSYLSGIKITDATSDKIINYVISKDVVATACRSLGVMIAVDEGMEPMLNMSDKKLAGLVIDKFLTKLHATGNFFMFINDDGMLDGRIRKNVLVNVVRDYMNNHDKYKKMFKDPSIPSIVRENADLIFNIAVEAGLDKVAMEYYAFGWLFSIYLESLILEHDKNTIYVGAYNNIKHDGLDGTKGSVDVKLV